MTAPTGAPAQPCIVELKTPTATEPLRQAIRHHALATRIVVNGFDPQATRPLRGAGLALGVSSPDVLAPLPAAWMGQRRAPRDVQALGIPMRWHGLPVPIRTLRGSGSVIHVWTLNNSAQARQLWAAGVQGIISDDPALMLRTRKRRA